jgi:hypothetical protein
MIRSINDWYVTRKGTFGATKPLHLVPTFILDKLVVQDVSYQTYINGVGVVLAQAKKAPFPPFPICIGSYNMENAREDKENKEELDIFHFGIERFKRPDTCGVIECHCSTCKYIWPY